MAEVKNAQGNARRTPHKILGRKKPPLIIAFEGIDGSGKTTQAMRFARLLKQRKIACSVIHYFDDRLILIWLLELLTATKKKPPKDTPRIRGLARQWLHDLVRADAPKLIPFVTAYSLKMGQLIHSRSSEIIILDRSPVSTYAYVYLMRENDKRSANFFSRKPIQKMMLSLPWPALTLHFDAPPQVTLDRIKKIGEKYQPHENVQDLTRMEVIYNRINPERRSAKIAPIPLAKKTEWKRINANQKRSNVTVEALAAIREYVSEHEELRRFTVRLESRLPKKKVVQ